MYSIPEGILCLDCTGSIDEAMPHADKARTASDIEHGDVATRDKILEANDVRNGIVDPTEWEPEHVQDGSEVVSTLRVVLHGWNAQNFTRDHKGVSPQEISLEPETTECPLSKTESEVYWRQPDSGPDFIRTFEVKETVNFKRDKLPKRLYKQQGSDTFQSIKDNHARFSTWALKQWMTVDQVREQVAGALNRHPRPDPAAVTRALPAGVSRTSPTSVNFPSRSAPMTPVFVGSPPQ